jgi:hypothetical protein
MRVREMGIVRLRDAMVTRLSPMNNKRDKRYSECK